MSKVTVTAIVKKIPVTTLGEENPTPLFRDFPSNQAFEIEVEKGITLEQNTIDTIGLYTGKKILPYHEQSIYQEKAKKTDVLHVCLENEKMKATILPEWGGRLLSLFDKEKNRELLYNPEQIILRNLAIRNAWFAGGVEWNIGYLGHTTSTASSVNCCILDLENKSQGVRIFSFERISCLWWQIDFVLKEKSAILEATVSVYNDEVLTKPLYWWSNMAVPEAHGTRVLGANGLSLWRSDIKKGFKYVKFPHPNNNSSIDYSYSTNYPKASEFFFDKPKDEHFPWISSVQKDGRAIFEASTKELPFRKVFCWGTHLGGKNWQKLLQDGRGSDYYEVQAGIAPSQLHSTNIKGRQTIQWKHSFGAIDFSAEKIHSRDWKDACSYAYSEIKKIVGNSIEATSDFFAITEKQPSDILQTDMCLNRIHFTVEQDSILPKWLKDFISRDTKKQEKLIKTNRWYKLLQMNTWNPYTDKEKIEWMLDDRYQKIFEEKIVRGDADWSIYLHLGVMARERFDFNKAKSYFEKSLSLKKNQFSYWGVIELASLEKDKVTLRYWIAESVQYLRCFDVKYHVMTKAKRFNLWDEIEKIIHTLDKDDMKNPKIFSILCELELYRGSKAKAMKYFLKENHYLREGDVNFAQIWRKLHDDTTKIPPLPNHLDYRMDPDI